MLLVYSVARDGCLVLLLASILQRTNWPPLLWHLVIKLIAIPCTHLLSILLTSEHLSSTKLPTTSKLEPYSDGRLVVVVPILASPLNILLQGTLFFEQN
ncbi:hypothetical protein ANCCAN_18637 [Ancylostoma caninum]|uniref:Uncharacterized protein n=1 Tax=Ancylostoma caninum TaxID=29170 RepID=A0A368FTK5_ANCCA|nr:hypothetical protein ANCCAN_18637 [Ancylostoma caninum]